MREMPFSYPMKQRLTFYFSISSLSANSTGENKLTGAIPTELGSLVKLKNLDLGEFMVLSWA
jgi:hypothetical protein